MSDENDGPGGRVPVAEQAAAAGGTRAGGEPGGDGKPAGAAPGRDRGVASPPSVKRQKVPPSSPKVQSGMNTTFRMLIIAWCSSCEMIPLVSPK